MCAAPAPTVSYILPTLNAGPLLENCLASIARQTLARAEYEIVIADAGSTDNTREIAKRFGALILDDPGRNMEEGKRLALAHASAEYVVFVDADNELTHPDYIELAIKALDRNPHALGVESYYLPSPKMSSFCAYLTHLLHISDPISWLMTVQPVLLGREAETERWTVPGNSLAYPLGANGFVFRRRDLAATQAAEQFQDTHVALHLMRSGKKEWLRIRGRGVHHYYIQTWWGFVRKRRRAIVHYLQVRERTRLSWARERPRMPAWLAGLYCASLVAPIYDTFGGILRTGDWRWLWHPLACWGSLLGTAWAYYTHRRNPRAKKLVADLQPRQTLLKDR